MQKDGYGSAAILFGEISLVAYVLHSSAVKISWRKTRIPDTSAWRLTVFFSYKLTTKNKRLQKIYLDLATPIKLIVII